MVIKICIILSKTFETKGSTLTGLKFFARVKLSFFCKIGVISASFHSFGNFFCMITCSLHIFIRYSQLISEDFQDFVGIFLYEPTFLLSRLLISVKISSDVISENWKYSLILIASFIERKLGWFSNFLIAISSGSSKFSVSVKSD